MEIFLYLMVANHIMHSDDERSECVIWKKVINVSRFSSNLSLINEYLEGYTNLSLKEIKERIQEDYEDGYISGSEYDHLMVFFID